MPCIYLKNHYNIICHYIFSLNTRLDIKRTNFTLQISDADGELKMESVAEGEIEVSMLDPNDVFLVDLGTHLYVWVGDGKSFYKSGFLCRI